MSGAPFDCLSTGSRAADAEATMNRNLGARTACPHSAHKLSALPFAKEKVCKISTF